MNDNIKKHDLFAYCITDGMLDEMSPEQRTALIRAIAEIKEEMMKDTQASDSD